MRRCRRGRLRCALSLLAMVPVLVTAVPAYAHVDVEADNATAGAQDVTLTFRIPNERAPLTTVGIRIIIPPDHPLIGVASSSQNGFTATVRTTHLAKAISGPDGPVSDVASEIDFNDGQITGSREPAFRVSVRQLPIDADVLTFRTLQAYSDGRTVAWIEVAADSAAEPEHPAPRLTLAQGEVGGAPREQSGAGSAAALEQGRGSTGPPLGLFGAIAAVAVAAITAGLWTHRRARRAGPSADPGDVRAGR